MIMYSKSRGDLAHYIEIKPLFKTSSALSLPRDNSRR